MTREYLNDQSDKYNPLSLQNLEEKRYAALEKLSQLIAEAQPIPDYLEEEILWLDLVINPRNWESTYKLVAAIFRQQRLPILNLSTNNDDITLNAEGQEEIDYLDKLAHRAAINLDTITVFAAIWAMMLRYPQSAYGEAKLATILAERGYLEESYSAYKRALSRQPLSENTWRSLAESASVIADYQPWRAKQLSDDLSQSCGTFDILSNVFALEVARIAGKNFPAEQKKIFAHSTKEIRLLAKHHFAVNELQGAYDLYIKAIKLELGESVRDILRNFGNAFGHILFTLDKEDEIRNLLDNMFDGECNLISAWISPESLQNARSSRSTALERQLPSALLVTPGKAGSVAVGNILSSGFNLPTMAAAISTNNVIPTWATEFTRGGCMNSSHLKASPHNVNRLLQAGVKRVILHVRDPRQIVVSFAHHLTDYRAQFGSIKGYSENLDASLSVRIDFVIREFLPQRVEWLKCWLNARDKLDIRITTYEMFVLERNRFIETILMHYGGDTRYFNRSNAEGPSGVDGHFRKGITDEWRSAMNKEQIYRMNEIIGERMLTTFGWE
jgi:tetratricopeptide (TPR) repeat protein